MYTRFVAIKRRGMTRVRTGIFIAAYALRRHGVQSGSRGELVRLLKWFAVNLPVPRDDAFCDGAGQCWFRSGVETAARQLWELKFLLERHGRRVVQIYNRDPGRITYQDLYQIVAVRPDTGEHGVDGADPAATLNL